MPPLLLRQVVFQDWRRHRRIYPAKCATLESTCSTIDSPQLTASRPHTAKPARGDLIHIILASTPLNPTGQDRSRCVISVAPKLTPHTTSLNLDPLLGSLSQHGMGYCTIAQLATAPQVFASFPQIYRPRHTGFCLLCPPTKCVSLKTVQKHQPRVPMDRIIQLRLPPPSHTIYANYPAGRAWRSAKLIS